MQVLSVPFQIVARLLCYKHYSKLKKSVIEQHAHLVSSDNRNLEKAYKLLVSGEDHRFLYHIGFDLIAIVRAVWNRLRHGRIEGGSTIEQQLVRVITNEYERTFKRKLREILLSTTLSMIISKEEVAILYLHLAYFGTDMIGVVEASNKLGLALENPMTIDQAADLISRIKYPQPSLINELRVRQIEARKKHLIDLYNKHSRKKYFKIYV